MANMPGHHLRHAGMYALASAGGPSYQDLLFTVPLLFVCTLLV
jgi:hypothetical protein